MSDIDLTAIEELDDLDIHPAAEALPFMDGDDRKALEDDVLKHGFREPVLFTIDGQLLDGRNRISVYLDLKHDGHQVAPPTVGIAHEEPYGLVWSLNYARRHLTPGQKAAVAERMANRGVGQSNSANLQNCISVEEAAKVTGASARNIHTVRKLRQEAPELAAEVEAGTMSVNKAAQEAKTRKAPYTSPVLEEAAAEFEERQQREKEERRIGANAKRAATIRAKALLEYKDSQRDWGNPYTRQKAVVPEVSLRVNDAERGVEALTETLSGRTSHIPGRYANDVEQRVRAMKEAVAALETELRARRYADELPDGGHALPDPNPSDEKRLAEASMQHVLEEIFSRIDAVPADVSSFSGEAIAMRRNSPHEVVLLRQAEGAEFSEPEPKAEEAPTTVCQWCSTAFEAKRSNAKYCSNSCRSKARRQATKDAAD